MMTESMTAGIGAHRSADTLEFMTSENAGFGTVAAEDDFLHATQASDHHSVAETHWFSFFDADSGLHGGIYVWAHPNLHTTSAGVWAFRGVKRHRMEAEHFNYQHHLPWPETPGREVRVPAIGLTIDIAEPLRSQVITYRDPASDAALELTTEAVMPPVVRGNGAHFEQVMRVRGTLTIAGDIHEIDCVSMRDRSWGEPRPEIAVEHPPFGFGVGASQDGRLAFVFNGTDDPDTADWAGFYDFPPERQFKDGWVFRDGELRKLIGIRRRSERDPATLQPTRLEVQLLDQDGGELPLVGEPTGALPFSIWSTMQANWCPMRWRLEDGTVVPGELQDGFWPSYVRQLRARSAR
jgi:hypothetical protein